LIETFRANPAQVNSSVGRCVTIGKPTCTERPGVGDDYPVTIEGNGNPIGNYLVTQIDAIWVTSPLSVAGDEVDKYTKSGPPGDQAKHAFDAMKKLMAASLVPDGLCVGVLENWQKVERVLYATDEQYRDHFLHPFNTYLLGLIVGKHIGVLDSDDQAKAWQYAAFFHDVGYPVQTE
jgi:hypothetical protein